MTRWRWLDFASMGEERKALIGHDAFEWVDLPGNAQAVPSRFVYKWKHNQNDGVAFRVKIRLVAQGFHEADTGTEKAALVASQ